MQGLKELEDTLGLTYEQLRGRVAHLKDSFEGITVEGKRGKWLVTDKGIALLKRLVELERDGHSFESATTVVLQEIQEGQKNGHKNNENTTPTDAHSTSTMPPLNGYSHDPLVLKVFETLQTQIAEKDRQISELLAQLRDLHQRALPPPKRSWWERIFGR